MTTPPALQWLYLDLNSFFASVEQQLRPELRGRPVAVVPAMTDSTCAIAASYEAKAYGIKTGTKIYEAKERCPELVCVPANHEHYVYFHQRIAHCLERQIPIYKTHSIDEFACALDRTQQNDATARALAQRIKAALKSEIGPYIRCSIGIAPNRFLAKLASNLKKPDGLEILHADDVPARIRHWPLDKLVGIGARMQLRLLKAGVSTIDELYDLSPKQMRALWGNVGGERYYHLLRGVELDDIPTKTGSVGHSHILEPAWRPVPQARLVMRRLTLKAASRMRRKGFYSSAMQMSLRLENGRRYAVNCRFEHCNDSPQLLQHSEMLWCALMQAIHATRIKKISVTLDHLQPDAAACQPELFDSLYQSDIQRRKRAEQLSRAMDALNSRFGRDTVTLGSLPNQVRCFSGTKVAFTRIPEQAEFFE